MPDPKFTELWTDYHTAEADRMARRALWVVIIFCLVLFFTVKGIYG